MEYAMVSSDVARERGDVSLVLLKELIRFPIVSIPLSMLVFASSLRGWGLGLGIY
jgi:hypothetical protein